MSFSARRRPGRPANVVPTIDWKVHIPIPIATKIDVFLLDPVTGNTRHGARSAFVTQLLVEWLTSRKIQPDTEKGGDLSGQER